MEESSQAQTDESVPKKPVPLPRKIRPNTAIDEPIYSNDGEPLEIGLDDDSAKNSRLPLRRLSKSFQEKIRSHGFEKSLRRMIPKRKSVAEKGAKVVPEAEGSNSLPDHNFFNNISFKSPLVPKPAVKLVRSDSEDSSDAESYHTTSELPPSYPPPPLPDESTYDELTSVSSEGRNSYNSPGSDSNSIYEELSNYLSLSLERNALIKSESQNKYTVQEPLESVRSGSWSYAESKTETRYAEIDEEPEILVPTAVEPVTLRSPEKAEKVTKCTVFPEFDPLWNLEEMYCPTSSKNSLGSNPFDDPQILAFLSDETDNLYGTIDKKTHHSILSDFQNMNFELPEASGPPPVPPRRYDSNADLEPAVEVEHKEPERRYNRIRSSIEFRVKQVARYVSDNIENGPLGRKQEKRSLLDKMHIEENVVNEEADSARPLSCEDVYVPLVLYHSGVLLRPGGVKRWGVLAQRKLSLFVSKDSPDVKETIPVDSILSLRITSNDKISLDGEQVLCFEVSLAGKSQPFVLGALSSSERHVWMRKLLESITPAFPPKLALDYDRAGRCYLKEGISSKWSLSSVLLSQRSLHLVPSNRSGALITADLRMARCLAVQEGELVCSKTIEKGPVLLVDVQEHTLYLQMDTSSETLAWEAVVRAAALNNGPALNQQQLTKDFVPTIVDKAINFVHTHGSASEGIYRRSGSNSTVSKLLTTMRKDAWAIQLSRTEFTEYDVASALKRFFMDLPEPLLVPELHTQFRNIVESDKLTPQERLEKYKLALTQLPKVNYRTVRRLVGHLYFVDKLNSKNRMPVENLAAIWGPTLMHIQEGTSLDPNWSRAESASLGDLITNYPVLFDVPEEELVRELQILNVLETFHSNSNCTPAVKKPSGDLKVWVYLNSQQDGDCVSVAVPPGKLARVMCDELSDRMNLPGHALCLNEVVSGASLTRPLHHTECVLDVVLRWGAWPEVDRRDNCLVLAPSTPLQELVPLTTTPLLPAVDQLKFSDARSKNFKNYLFELSQSTLICYKDKTCSVKVHEWNLKDITWYLGFEAKRNPHAGWAITFFTKDSPPVRTKDRPFFGNTLCGTTEQQRRKWVAALLTANHPAGILPPPLLIE